MRGRDEIETMLCAHDSDASAQDCSKCRGSRRRPLRDLGFLWADGMWRTARPPSEEPIPIKANGAAAPNPAPRREPESSARKPLPKSFKPNARTLLRERALSLAISASHVVYRGGTTAPQLLKDAEYIARWIADTPMEKP